MHIQFELTSPFALSWLLVSCVISHHRSRAHITTPFRTCRSAVRRFARFGLENCSQNPRVSIRCVEFVRRTLFSRCSLFVACTFWSSKINDDLPCKRVVAVYGADEPSFRWFIGRCPSYGVAVKTEGTIAEKEFSQLSEGLLENSMPLRDQFDAVPI